MRLTRATHKNINGFSLIELLLVISLIIIVALISVPLANRAIENNDREIAKAQLVEALRTAHLYAKNNRLDDRWGVSVTSDRYTIFKGDSYLTRDTQYDEEFKHSLEVYHSGVAEVWFEQITGEPSTTGNIIISTESGDVNQVTINSIGRISEN